MKETNSKGVVIAIARLPWLSVTILYSSFLFFTSFALAEEKPGGRVSESEAVFLDLSKVNLGTIKTDPSYEDAAMLRRAALALQGTKKTYLSESQFVDHKFAEAMTLYREGRLAEAATRMEETSKLAPSNLKAKYWLHKFNGELAD